MKNEWVEPALAFPPAPSDDAVWLVKTPAGICTWSLDELDAAFQQGEVDASTYVYTSGMTAWTPLGVIARLDEPSDAGDTANDTPVFTPSEPGRPRVVATPGGASFAPMSSGAFGVNGTTTWASIKTSDAEIQTGVRHRAAVLPFALRRVFGAAFDALGRLRAAHPRWVALGPWLCGAALSGLFIGSIYRLANAPVRPRVAARSIASAPAPAPSPVRPPTVPSARALSPRRPAPTTPASTALASDDFSDASNAGVVLRASELSVAGSRSARQLARAARAKAQASGSTSRAKARARKARRKSSARALAE